MGTGSTRLINKAACKTTTVGVSSRFWGCHDSVMFPAARQSMGALSRVLGSMVPCCALHAGPGVSGAMCLFVLV